MEAQETPIEPGGEELAEAPVENIQTATQQPPPAQEEPPPAAAQEPGPPPWVDGITSSFAQQLGRVRQEIVGDIDQRLSPLEQALQREPEPQEPYDPAMGYYDDDFDVRAEVQRLVEERVGPIEEERRREGFESLIDEFDHLQTDEGQQALVEAVEDEAQRLGKPDLARHPGFARMVHLANMGQGTLPSQAAEAEQPEADDSPFQRFWREDREDPKNMLQGQLDQAVTERVQQELAPIRQHQLDEGFDRLMEEFPALATKEGAEPVAVAAQEWAARWGNPAMAGDPSFARFMYLAQQGERIAASETPAGDGSNVQLEQGGATPAEPQEDDKFIQMWAKKQQNTLRWDSH